MKPFTILTVAFLAIVAVLQLVRFFLGWPISIEGTEIPVWVSAIAALVAGGLAALLWHETFGWHMPASRHLPERIAK